jgi:hypothetical protein
MAVFTVKTTLCERSADAGDHVKPLWGDPRPAMAPFCASHVQVRGSVGTGTGCVLDDEDSDLPVLHTIQTGSEAHLASCPVRHLGAKQAGREAPFNAEVKNG